MVQRVIDLLTSKFNYLIRVARQIVPKRVVERVAGLPHQRMTCNLETLRLAHYLFETIPEFYFILSQTK